MSDLEIGRERTVVTCDATLVARPLPHGVYEHPITRELEAALQALDADRQQLGAIGDAESPAVVARHVAQELARVLDGTDIKDRAEVARALVLLC